MAIEKKASTISPSPIWVNRAPKLETIGYLSILFLSITLSPANTVLPLSYFAKVEKFTIDKKIS